jgi:predicted amidohydrolase
MISERFRKIMPDRIRFCGVMLTGLLLSCLFVSGRDMAPDNNQAPPSIEVSSSGTIVAAVVQMRSSEDLDDNVSRITGFIREASGRGARVVVFPECALTSYKGNVLPVTDPALLARAESKVIDACRDNDVYAILGTPYYDGQKYYVSATVISPAGKVIERYHKIQLAGENWAESGRQMSVFMVDDVPCSIIICHDERYPELVRLPVLAGAKVIFYISHESGIREEHKISPYRAQIKARAVENTVWVLHSNAPANLDASGSNGHSRIISPTGNIIQEASIFGEDILIGELDISRATRSMALRSLNRGPLQEWWKEGVKHVKIIDPE